MNSSSFIAIALRDETYLLDFVEKTSPGPINQISKHIIDELRNYSETHCEKILGVAFARNLQSHIPGLCSHLWAELDILPILLDEESDTDASPENVTRVHFDRKPLDEQAESLSRKCMRYIFDLVHKLDILLWMFGMAYEIDHKSTDSLDRPNCLFYMLDSIAELKWILHSTFDSQTETHFSKPLVRILGQRLSIMPRN